MTTKQEIYCAGPWTWWYAWRPVFSQRGYITWLIPVQRRWYAAKDDRGNLKFKYEYKTCEDKLTNGRR